MKKGFLVLIFEILIIINLYGEVGKINYKGEMRNLIAEIRQVNKDKIIIANGGVGVYFEDENIEEEFVKNNIDGVLVESVLYGYGGYNKKTPKEAQDEFLKYIEPIKALDKEIFLLDYTNEISNRKTKKKFLEKTGYKGENALTISLNNIYEPLKKSTKSDVFSLKDVNNFLIMLNYEKFSSSEELVKTLSYTDFDFLIIDAYFKGKLITEEELSKIKVSRNGKIRKVIAYLSIGESENYRSYWQKEWDMNFPDWIVKENENWEGNFVLKYWSKEWKKIVKENQKEILSVGFDGYFLDTIDSYEYFENVKEEKI